MKRPAQKSRPGMRWLKINRDPMLTRLCQKSQRVRMAFELFMRRMIEIFTGRRAGTWRRLEIWGGKVQAAPKHRWQKVTIMKVIFWNKILGPVWAQKITLAACRTVRRPLRVQNLPKNQKFPPIDMQRLISRTKLRLFRSKPQRMGKAKSEKNLMWMMTVVLKYSKSYLNTWNGV